jgi:hypothetical protein
MFLPFQYAMWTFNILVRAACKLVEIANSVEAVLDGRIYIELINGRCCSNSRPRRPNTPPGSIWRSSAAGSRCTRAVRFVRFTRAGADLFA